MQRCCARPAAPILVPVPFGLAAMKGGCAGLGRSHCSPGSMRRSKRKERRRERQFQDWGAGRKQRTHLPAYCAIRAREFDPQQVGVVHSARIARITAPAMIRYQPNGFRPSEITKPMNFSPLPKDQKRKTSPPRSLSPESNVSTSVRVHLENRGAEHCRDRKKKGLGGCLRSTPRSSRQDRRAPNATRPDD